MKFKILENEYWWGGKVHDGHKMPFSAKSDVKVSLWESWADQASGVFVSSKGRYIYSDKPFDIVFKNGEIDILTTFDVVVKDGFGNLKGAVRAVSENFKKGKVPDLEFLNVPQYNTWIELGYNQNEEGILNYVRNLVKAGMPSGILMIDEGWSEDYGVYDFYPGRFRSPKKMVDELHSLGFKVMLWVTHFISPDSNTYRYLMKNHPDYIIKKSDGSPKLIKWWNGYSTSLDLTNPGAREWFDEKLKGCMGKYGVDGFKFDAGSMSYYSTDDMVYVKELPQEQAKEFSCFGMSYKYHELRQAWDLSGAPLVSRLQDKSTSWDSGQYTLGIKSLIPNMIAQGLIGYYFGCPDMIGGGSIGDSAASDELYLRWLEVSVLCPMMQFSISPVRILSEENAKTAIMYANMHSKYGKYIEELAFNAAKNGDPIMRHMAYEFPDEGFEEVDDQFMLGDKYLVAPVVNEGETVKNVKLPKGKWKDLKGKIFDGGTELAYPAPLDVLPVFEKAE